jgi:hypothetical protein
MTGATARTPTMPPESQLEERRTVAATSRDDGRLRRLLGRLLGRPVTTPLVALIAFASVLTGLLLRNASLFTVRLYEVGDAAANSLLVNDARDLDLLVGHYSRVGFNHPGPAVLYVQAFGEAVFTDLLGLTRGPYNGQVLAVLILLSAVVAAVVAMVHAWSGRLCVALAALAVAVVWFEGHTWSISATWIPLVVVAPFLLLLVSAASVASGRVRHLWLLAGVGGLLVHAHVEFALFVPALALAALVTWALVERATPRALWRRSPRDWITALAVLAVFVIPIALNTVVNWPGEIPEYFAYSNAQATDSPSLTDALRYAVQFWSPASPLAPFVPVLLVAAAAASAWWAPRALRRPLLTLTAFAVLAEGLFVLYALVGVDDLEQDYIGSFSWSVPLSLLLVVTVSLTAHLASRQNAAVATGVLSAVLVAVAFIGDGTRLRSEAIDKLPQTLALVERAADGERVVLDIGEGTGPFVDGTGLLVHLERAGREVCVLNSGLGVQLTPDRICSAAEQADGQVFELREIGSRPIRSFRGMQSDITVVR